MSSVLSPPGPSGTAAHLFQRAAAASADCPALRQGASLLTYQELSREAGCLADWLRAQGVGRGDVVATVMDRSHRCMTAVLGAWAVGAAYVHIEATDPGPRIAALLETTNARAVVTDRRNLSRLAGYAPPTRLVDEPAEGSEYVIAPGLGPDDVAYLVCTSGSTGKPKAVVVQHRALLNFCDAFRQQIQPRLPGSYGLTTTFAADLGKASVYGALLSGARLDVFPRDTVLDPVALAADLAAHPVDCLTYTPSQLEALAGQGELSQLLPRQLLVVAGEAFPPRLADAIRRASPDLTVYNGYGPSEATILATMHRVEPADARGARVPIGVPLAGVEARVLDADGRPVPEGTPGVLHLGGLCVADGYLGETALTEAKFVRLSDGPDAPRFYCTDDLVSQGADGVLDYLGRGDRQLKVRGNRVEPGEVETALLAHPGVHQAVVTGERAHPDAPLELAAYVVGDAEPQGLTRRLRDVLPSAMVPSRLHPVPEIPVNLNGKVDFPALRAAARAATPRSAAADPPLEGTEQLIADIWSDVLGRSGIGRQERFLEIGGNSFKALTVFARLRRHYPGLVIAQLYAHSTVAALSEALDGTAPAPGLRAAPGAVVEL